MTIRDVADAATFQAIAWTMIWFAWEITRGDSGHMFRPIVAFGLFFLAMTAASLVLGF